MGRKPDRIGQLAPKPGEVPDERWFKTRALALWTDLVDGFRHDVEHSPQLTGAATFELRSDSQCRIASGIAQTDILVTLDLEAHTIEYTYQAEDPNTAVPEGGVLTLRAAGSSIDLYSADQKLTTEQVRGLILEPLLSPPQPLKATGT
jgi:hypothetical protein